MTRVFFERNFRLLIYGPQLNNFISKPVEESEFHAIPQLFEYMVEVMRRANGCGLAAPQIGCFKNFVLVELIQGSVVGLVNPEIIRSYGKEIQGREACLSFPPEGNDCMVPRLENVDVETSLAGSPDLRRKFTFRGQVARIVQHELDHLTGTFFIDRASQGERQRALEKFKNWKEMRKSKIRRSEENGNVSTGFVTAISS